MKGKYNLPERRVCRAMKICRSSARYVSIKRDDEDEVTGEIIELSAQYGRYGYRRITALMRAKGRCINHKRVERIWRQAGLKVPQKQPKKKRLWLNDGSCIRLRPEHRNHVWSYDFVEDRLRNGKKVRWLNFIDEHTKECLASIPKRKWDHRMIIEVLADVMLMKGTPCYLRSDNGSEFIAKKLREWLSDVAVQTAYIEPGSPWENGYCESFNSRMRDEFLNGEIFDTMWEVEVLTRRWVHEYNTIRPHSSIGYRPPAPQVIVA